MIDVRHLLFTPNLLSFSRLLLGPLILLLFDAQDPAILMACLGLMVIAECTDLADGIVARRSGQVTDLGKLLDPMSDSVYRFCVFLALFGAGLMPAWMICIVFVRDILVAYTRIYAATKGMVISARPSGKAKAVVQGIAQFGVVAVLAFQASLQPVLTHALVEGLLWAATLVTAYSAFDYVVGGSRATAAQRP